MWLAALFILADLGAAGGQYACIWAAVVILAEIWAHSLKFRLFVLYGTFFCMSCVYAALKSEPSGINSAVTPYEKTSACVSGVIKNIDKTDYGISCVLSDCHVQTEKGGSDENVLVYINSGVLPENEALCVGFGVNICGYLKKFEQARNDGGFNADLYYRSTGAAYRMYAEKIQVTGRNYGIEYATAKMREAVGRQFEKIAGEETCGVLRAVLLGDRSGISEDTYELFKKNGIAHILAISGLHISFLASVMYTVMRRAGAGFFPSFALCASVLALYCIMTGNSVSAKRAVIMYIIKMGADLTGRSYDALSALAAAALLVCFENIYVIYNAGFQLSFGAILGTAVMCPAVERMLPASLKKSRICSALSGSIGISIFTAPVVLYHYFELPLYAPVLNIFVIPLMSVLLVSAAAGAAVSVISVHAGVFLMGTVHYILKFYSFLCRAFQSLPSSRIVLGRPSYVQCVLFYFIIFAFVLLSIKLSGLRCRIKALLCALSVMTACLSLNARRTFDAAVDMIDVGQGDSILVRSGAGQTYLFDAGSSDIKNVGERRIFPLLRSLGVTEIDCIFVSHCDEDHINGVRELMSMQDNTFRIRKLMLPSIINSVSVAAYTELEKTAAQHGTEVEYSYAGAEVVPSSGKSSAFGGGAEISVTCIHPQKGYNYSDTNDYSAVYLIKCGSFKMLMTGDAEERAERAFLGNREVSGLLSDISVLKFGHHGSASSGSDELLEKLNIKAAFISCGINNIYGHPAESTVERLKKYGSDIYVTAECGQIKLRLKGKDFSVETKLGGGSL